MSSLAIAGLVFACVIAAALLAMLIGRALPASHLNAESKDVVKLGLGVIATLTALVLGLLIAAAKGTFDTQSNSIKQLSANVVLLDRLLGRYGPETKETRELLHRAVTIMLGSLWPEDGTQKATLTPGAAMTEMEAFYDKLGELSPKTDAQRVIKGRALDLTTELAQTRLRLAAQKDSSIPLPFLVVLVFWLVVLFGGFGLMAPRNATVVVVLIVCALSISTAMFLILELDRPFDGIVRVPSAPVRDALSLIGK
jgi:Protein of unknown function (DUF4239)